MTEAERERLRQSLLNLIASLEALEWSEHAAGSPACPYCGHVDTDGHDAECAVAEALRSARALLS